MKKYSFYIGIDISKLKLDVNIFNSQNNSHQHLVIENNPKEIKNLIKTLKSNKLDLSQTLFCCENTGIYTNLISSFLTELNLDLWVVPAIEIKKSKGISRGKSDKSDAKDIALYSFRNLDKLNLFALNHIDIQKLKLLHTEREKILKSILALNTTKENEHYTPKSIYKEVEKINKKAVDSLKKILVDIEKRIHNIIKNNEELCKKSELIQSIPGIGQQTAVYLLIATKGFSAFDNGRKFACYSGIAPFEYSSGSSIRGRTKVNHFADKKMKSLLQMCALTAVKYDPQIKEYYHKKKTEGKNSMLILNNIRCKFINRVFAVIKRKTPFINTYKFAG